MRRAKAMVSAELRATFAGSWKEAKGVPVEPLVETRRSLPSSVWAEDRNSSRRSRDDVLVGHREGAEVLGVAASEGAGGRGRGPEQVPQRAGVEPGARRAPGPLQGAGALPDQRPGPGPAVGVAEPD